MAAGGAFWRRWQAGAQPIYAARGMAASATRLRRTGQAWTTHGSPLHLTTACAEGASLRNMYRVAKHAIVIMDEELGLVVVERGVAHMLLDPGQRRMLGCGGSAGNGQ